MKPILSGLLTLTLAAFFASSHAALAQGTFITYQGRLSESNAPANGVYDLRFRLFDNSSGGTQLGNFITRTANVTNGLFAEEMNFGTNFAGGDRWLQVEVRTNGTFDFTILDPRQRVTAAPYATYALSAATAQTAATASEVADGIVVKSVNSLKDDVVLQAGSNVTVTPDGNTLTIASSGAGIWNVNGNDAYFDAGNVGIGTSNPANKLTLLTSPSSYGFEHTDGTVRMSTFLGGSAGGGWLGTMSNHRLNFFVNDGSASMTLHPNGALGIGTISPRVGYKLEVNGAAVWTPTGLGGTEIAFGTPNGECGMTIIGSARADIRFDGSTLKLLAGPLGGPPSSASGVTINTSGNVGIGTTIPTAKLDVTGAFDAIHGVSTGNGIGVYGSSANVGVYGSGSGNGEGVHGRSFGNGAAVNGTSTAGGTGVYGSSASGWAGYFAGNVNATGEVYANSVRGHSQNGLASIYGRNDSPTGSAGYFQGNATVTGTLTKGGGSFKIDHPLDPANKSLSHSFVESPDMMNIYNGNIALDDKGEAVVQMPEWFNALNKEFRYQLTCIGGFAPVYVAEEITANQFKIAGGKKGLKVSWQVTGIRQDAWANAHRIPVEETKQMSGTYLHPALFGKTEGDGSAQESSRP